jgi:hypothetical protein
VIGEGALALLAGMGGRRMAEATRDWPEVWEDWHVEAKGYLELDSERPGRGFDTCVEDPARRDKFNREERGKPWTQSPTSRSQIMRARC